LPSRHRARRWADAFHWYTAGVPPLPTVFGGAKSRWQTALAKADRHRAKQRRPSRLCQPFGPAQHGAIPLSRSGCPTVTPKAAALVSPQL
jgi:hypothetical protein